MRFEDKFYVLYFFTTWSFFLCLFHSYFYKCIDLMYLSFVVLIVGTYLSFVYPRKYVVEKDKNCFVFDNITRLLCIDLVVHLLMFVLIYKRYHSYYSKSGFDFKICMSLVLIAIYFVMLRNIDVYLLPKIDMIAMLIVSSILYLVVLYK